ncbi:Rho/RAC guanine nucleotide exchange factor [Entamoeba marina]
MSHQPQSSPSPEFQLNKIPTLSHIEVNSTRIKTPATTRKVNDSPLKRSQRARRSVLFNTQFSLSAENTSPDLVRHSLIFPRPNDFNNFIQMEGIKEPTTKSITSNKKINIKGSDGNLHDLRNVHSTPIVMGVDDEERTCEEKLKNEVNLTTSFDKSVMDFGQVKVIQTFDGVTYTLVDNDDLDILISRDSTLLNQYLQRNRISVGFPFKGYKEALVLDIRNGDDNPRQQIAEIVSISQKRKIAFKGKHFQQPEDPDFFTITTSTQPIVNEQKVQRQNSVNPTHSRPKSPSVISFEKYKKPSPQIYNAAQPKRKMSISITGFIDQTEFKEQLDEDEKQEFETYRETLMELWYTEEAHVQSLHALANVYLRPLANGKYGKLVRKINVQIDQLLKLHTLFYHKLTTRIEDAGDDIPIIADLLRYFFHFVKSTCAYIVDYNANLKLVNVLMTHASVHQTLAESKQKYAEANPSITIQRIQSYLIMPIQRIPRYVLLIKVMICNAPPLSPDTDKLVECYQLILEVAAWINEKKLLEEEREKYNTVLKVISGLYDLNKSCRRYIVSGCCDFLDMNSKEGISTAYFFLFNDVLIQTKVVKHDGHKIKSKQKNQTHRIIEGYTSVDDFNNDLFQVERVFMVTEDSIVSYITNPSERPALSFTSPLSDLQVTLVFNHPLDANAWFVALAYTIQLSPRVNDAKGIFNMRNG